MLGPRLQLTKYVSQLDKALLSNYISKLGLLHKDFQGIALSNWESAPIDQRPVEEIINDVMALLSTDKVTHGDRVCQHQVIAHIACGSFSWKMEIKRFRIQMSAFFGVIGAFHTDDDGFTEAYGDEDKLLHGVARGWIEQGVCNTVFLARKNFSTLSDGWGDYFFSKILRASLGQARYNGHSSRPCGDLLDLYGELSVDKRAEISSLLDLLESSVNAHQMDYLQYSGSNYENSAFVQSIDMYLLDLFGEVRFLEMLSVLGVTFDLWVEGDN